jgi:hypothetical protein
LPGHVPFCKWPNCGKSASNHVDLAQGIQLDLDYTHKQTAACNADLSLLAAEELGDAVENSIMSSLAQANEQVLQYEKVAKAADGVSEPAIELHDKLVRTRKLLQVCRADLPCATPPTVQLHVVTLGTACTDLGI